MGERTGIARTTDVDGSRATLSAGTTRPDGRDRTTRALSRRPQEDLRGAPVGTVAIVVALVPVAVAALRAGVQGWAPLADNAIFVIRALDVFSRDHFPLLGTASSASQGAGLDLHHPGPLLFDVLAVPVRLLGTEGAAIGVAALNGASVLVSAVFAHRRQGALGALVASLVAVTLCWSMGSGVLVEPWNPHSMVLPFLAFLFLTWSVACGDVLAIPILAAAGSLVAQTHLSYVVLVLVLGGWAAAGLVLELRRRRRADPHGWATLRRRAVRAGAGAAVIVVVCWAQPLGQQFFGEGHGNLSKLVESSTGDHSSGIGFADGTRVVADVVAVPPGWLPSSFETPWAGGYFPVGVPRLGVAVAALLVLAGVLTGCGILARRLGDRVLGLAVATAGIGVLVAIVNAASAPLTVANVPPHHFRWLWALGAFVTFALLSTVARVVVRTHAGRSWAAPALAACVGLVALAAVPVSDQGSQPDWAVPVMRRVASRMDALEGRGPFFVRSPGLNDYFTVAVLAELRARGIPFVVDRGLSRQVGEERRVTARSVPRAELRVLLGDDKPGPLPAGAEVVVRDRGVLSGAQRRELADVREELVRELAGGSIRARLHPQIERFLAGGAFPTLRRQLRRGVWAPDELLAAGELLPLADAGLVLTDADESELVERLRRLQGRLNGGTVTIVIMRVDPAVVRRSTA